MKDAPINLPLLPKPDNADDDGWNEGPRTWLAESVLKYARAAVLADRAGREEWEPAAWKYGDEVALDFATDPHKRRFAVPLYYAAPSPAEPPYGANQRWHICPGCAHQFQSRGSAEFHQEPPPVDNKFVAPGCEPFPQSVVDAVADVGSAAYMRIAGAERLLIKAREELQNYLDDCPVTPEEPDTVKTVLAGIDAFIASAEPLAAPVQRER